MVLAAGLGSRLRPLTDHCAKALVPVGDRPILAHVVGRLRAAGVPRVVVNAHHRSEDIEQFALGRADFVGVSHEPNLLGTAGGIAHAATMLGGGDILVWNADILADPDLGALVAAHDAEATLVVQRRPAGEGAVGVDESDRIVRLRRVRVGEERHGADYVCVHVLGAGLRRVLPERGCLVGDVFIPALLRGARLRAFWHRSAYFDVGTVDQYLEANFAWLAARTASTWVGPGASVSEGVTLDRAVVGAGARVDGKGLLSRCVVWPAGQARAPLSGAVVTDALPHGAFRGPPR